MAGYMEPYTESSISPSTIMEAAFGRLHNSGAGAFGARPTVVESIMVDGEIDGAIYGTTYECFLEHASAFKSIHSELVVGSCSGVVSGNGR